jgi:choline dehydrogenase
VSYAFVEACTAAGHPEEPDKNAPGTDGVGVVPRNVLDGFRMNTAATYLAPARGRPNLTVMGETSVRRVLFDGARAIGVEAERRGERLRFEAGEVVLSAGGIKSPHLLLVSGIGPADAIRGHGIAAVHDSPGVGRNVKDHPSATVYYQVRDDGRPLPVDFTTPFQTCVNYASSGAGESDLQITCGAASYGQMLRGVAGADGKHARIPSYLKRPLSTLRNLRRLPTRFVVSNALNSDNLALLVQLEAEQSTGEILLASADPADAPRIRLGYLTHADDLPRIMANVRHAMELLRSPPFERLGVKRIDPTDEDVASDASLETWIRAKLGTSLHTSCSARMGPASDPTAVVDQRCRVHGVEGLRVVDISIMPTITRRGPAATAVMIGERAAALFDSSDEGERGAWTP